MRRRTRVAVVGDHGTAALAVAAGRLDWKVAAAAGAVAPDIRAATGAKVRTVDELLDRPDADVVVVGTDAARRIGDAYALSERGTPTVLVPGRFDRCDLDWTPGAPLVIGDTMPTAPAVQRWFRLLGGRSGIQHVSVTCADASGDARPSDRPLEFSAFGVALLSARSLGLASTDDIEVTTAPAIGLARFEMQCATPTDVVRVEMFPVPTVEHNGTPVTVGGSGHPATAFGALDLLRTFHADVISGRRPALGLAYLRDVLQLLADAD